MQRCWNYQTGDLKQLCDIQGQEMDFVAQEERIHPSLFWGFIWSLNGLNDVYLHW